MLDKLEALKDKYTELSEKLSDPDILSDSQKLQKLMKEQAQPGASVLIRLYRGEDVPTVAVLKVPVDYKPE